MSKKSTTKPNNTNNICSIKNFIYKTEQGQIDITPLFVFMAGVFCESGSSQFKAKLCQFDNLEKKLSEEVIQKFILEYIEKNPQRYNIQAKPELLLGSNKKLNTLYKNIMFTFSKTIQIVDDLVFLNINYDFSEKMLDFMHFSFIFELYKTYLLEENVDKSLIYQINSFFISNSTFLYTEDIKKFIHVKEGQFFLDQINQIIKFLTKYQADRGQLEEQESFQTIIKDFPEIVSYLSVNYGSQDLNNYFNNIYDGKKFSPRSEDKASLYYADSEYIPLTAVSNLGKRYAWSTFENIVKEAWYNAQIQYNCEDKDEKIKKLKENIEVLEKEKKNLNRTCNKKSTEVEKLTEKLNACEENIKKAVQKAKDEACVNEEELEELRVENFLVKNKLAKQANRIENLSEKVETQLQIINRVPNILDYIHTESELEAGTEEEITCSQQKEKKPSIEEMQAAIGDKKLFFIHGIQGYEKNLEDVFTTYNHLCVNDKMANFTIPLSLDGVVVLVKTTPHAHLDRVLKIKQDDVPFIPSTNKNINLVIEDIYNYFYK